MQDRELYQRISGGIAPWTVGEINVASADQRLEVQVECNDGILHRCPRCECMLLACDQSEEQSWRQPDDGPWQILLKGRLPLIECPEHGIVRVSPPWADWFVRGLGNSLEGPWSLQQLKLLMDAGRILPSTLLKRGSSNRWVIAGTVGALFVRQDETLEPALSIDELAAVDWAIANEPVVLTPTRPTASESMVRDGSAMGNASVADPRHHSKGYRIGDSHKETRHDRQATPPHVTGFTPTGHTPEVKSASVGEPELGPVLRLLGESDRDTGRDSVSSHKRLPPSAPRKSEKQPATQGVPHPLPRLRKLPEPSPSEWGMAIEQAVAMEHAAEVIREKPVDDTASQRVQRDPRRDALVRRRGFQDGFQLLAMAYLMNACLVCCLVPAVCMVFFSRLLLLSSSVFVPFQGGNDLQEGQLVECGLAALSLLVLIGFPLWHLKSNDGVLWHYVPSALVGMTIGFALSPDYLDEICSVLKWCQFGFGIATVGLTVYTLSAVPARSRLSLPMIAAGLLTAITAISLCFVRSGSMLSVQADAVPPQFRGTLPDAPLYVIGLYGTLVLIPGAILIELYRHTNFSTRQFIIRTGVILGVYLLAGLVSVGPFVEGAGSGFFDVPIALLPLACINAMAAGIPSALLLVDPQYTVTDD